MKKKNIKTDKFKRVRGGDSRLLEITCQTCNALICIYQKDGPGALLRMYIDRISEPAVPLSGKTLMCSNNHIVGNKTTYIKENRPAFRLVPNSIHKKIVKD